MLVVRALTEPFCPPAGTRRGDMTPGEAHRERGERRRERQAATSDARRRWLADAANGEGDVRNAMALARAAASVGQTTRDTPELTRPETVTLAEAIAGARVGCDGLMARRGGYAVPDAWLPVVVPVVPDLELVRPASLVAAPVVTSPEAAALLLVLDVAAREMRRLLAGGDIDGARRAAGPLWQALRATARKEVTA